MALTEVAEKEVPVIDEVFLGAPRSIPKPNVEDDVFSKSAEDIRTFDGMSPAFKRKTTRELMKVRQGSDGAARSKQVEVETISGYLLFDVILPPYNLEYLAKLYHASAPHNSAVNAKVSNIVGLGYQFIESPRTKIKMDEAEDEETKSKLTRKVQRARLQLEELFETFNEEDSFLEVLKKVWTDYEATGNGYIEIGRKNNGEIGYIGHIPATVMRVRKQRDGFVQITADKVIFFRNFGGRARDPLGNDPRPNEVIHIKKYSPTNTFYGVPDIIAAQQAVAGNEFAARFNLDYFENKAVPRYVIVTKGANLSAKAQLRLTEFFQTSLKGQNHRTIYIPLPAEQPDQKVSFEMNPVEAGTQDASFMNYHKTNVDLILMAHRVPITKISAIDVPLAAARDLDKTFKEQVCRPEQTVFESKVNRIVKELTDMFLLKLNELSLTDEKTQADIDNLEINNGSALPNEVRARKGLPAIKDGATTINEKAVEQLELQQAHQEKLAAEAAKAQKAAAAARPTSTPAGAKAAQKKADTKANTTKTRARDTARSAGATDSRGEGRNEKGAGRTTK